MPETPPKPQPQSQSKDTSFFSSMKSFFQKTEKKMFNQYVDHDILLINEGIRTKALKQLHQQYPLLSKVWQQKFMDFHVKTQNYCQKVVTPSQSIQSNTKAFYLCQEKISGNFLKRNREKRDQIWKQALSHEEKWMGQCLMKKYYENEKFFVGAKEEEVNQYINKCVEDTRGRIVEDLYRQTNSVFQQIVSEDVKSSMKIKE